MELTKFKKSELSSVKKELIKRQHGLCPICGGSLIGVASMNVVVDHDHSTGVVRAAMHRGCNGMEGKILRFLKTWGKASTQAQVVKTLERLLSFWSLHATPQTEWIYYGYKTATEKRLATNKKRRLAAKKKREK
jgi:hypothetical protein